MKNTILILVLILSTHTANFAQVLTDFPCYAVSGGYGQPNILFEYDPITKAWNKIGDTGGTSIGAIATDPTSNIIYAVDGGKFGTINPNTALFSPIGNIGTATGSKGSQIINEVKGLTYDPINQIMYATQRFQTLCISPSYGCKPDLLFQIDISTGSFVPGAMIDFETSAIADYAVMSESPVSSSRGVIYYVSDIAYNPNTGKLFAMHDGYSLSTLTELNTQTGQVKGEIMEFPEQYIQGLAFNYLGELFATGGVFTSTQRNSKNFMHIDLSTGSTTLLNTIDPTDAIINFESLDFFPPAANNQILTDFPCYAVSSGYGTTPDILFEYDTITKAWIKIGDTGTTSIGAIATDPISGIIYTVDGGMFGTINPKTGFFTAIGNIGTTTGAKGSQDLNHIKGLTYDPINQKMYAAHRFQGTCPGPSFGCHSDLLFQIDLSTGSFVPSAMIDGETGTAADYAVVQKSFNSTPESFFVNVNDIAYNPKTDKLFAIHGGYRLSTLTELNPQTGQIVAEIAEYPNYDVVGLAFNYSGELFGTTGNVLMSINQVTGTAIPLSVIDQIGSSAIFESIDCFPPVVNNDLVFETNYSGTVSITLDNNKNHIKNKVAVVYDYSTCPNYPQNCNPAVGADNLEANEALWAATKAAEYFSKNFGIQIPQISLVVNYTEEPNNARYNPENNVIFFGAGDGIEMNSMTTPDIVAHEYTHAIINSLQELGSFGIPGALNESYADIFAELIENSCYGSNDWILGSQAIIGNKAGIRNLSEPKDVTMKYQLPDTYEGEHWKFINDMCFADDNCGIHTNSGVHSYWYYLLAKGGSGTNDFGYTYNVNGIGTDKVAAILMDNLINHLNPQSTFNETRNGSISSAIELCSDDPLVLFATFDAANEAWNAVGVYSVIEEENSINFKFKNSRLSAPVTVENGKTIIPIQIELNIDSLGLPLSADELCFNFHLPKNYSELSVKKIYEPLSANELSIEGTSGLVNICINRQAKNGSNYAKIESNSSIVQLGVCIVSENLTGEGYVIPPIYISGNTKISPNEVINFKPDPLPFGFDYKVYCTPLIEADDQNSFEISLELNHKNCQTLGAIEIEILNNFLLDVPPYTYTLKTASGILQDKIKVTDSNTHQFYNLEEGEYVLDIKDNDDNFICKTFSIDFVGRQTGSLCCTENLIIPPGNVSGTFNTDGIISFSEGTTVTEGTFEVCND